MTKVRPFFGLMLASIATVSQSQSVPDAGHVLRETNLPIDLRKLSKAVPISVAPAEPLTKSTVGAPVTISAFRISGNTVFSEAALQALLVDAVGTSQTLAQMQALAARITQYYRQSGFLVARAYLPQQQLEGGLLMISILEGRLAELRLENSSLLSDATAQAALKRLHKGIPVRQSEVDHAILLLGDTPGAGSVDARLAPGNGAGDTVLIVSVRPAPVWSSQLVADNHGGRYTGRNRLAVAADASSSLGWGERFSARLVASDKDLVNARVSAQLPVLGSGTTLAAAWARATYALGDTYAALDAVGRTDTVELSLRHPWLRGVSANVSTYLALEQRKLRDEVRSTQTLTDKSARVGTFSVQADARDSWAGGGWTAGHFAVASGDVAIRSASALELDAAGPRTNGSYTKWSWRVDRQQAMTRQLSLRVLAHGQWTGDNLDSSEKFSLGGANGVRAYASGEATGDRGWLASIELRYALTSAVSVALFNDTGRVTVNAEPFQTGSARLLRRGSGIGATGTWGALEVRASAAWRGDEPGTSEPDSRRRMWVQGLWQF